MQNTFYCAILYCVVIILAGNTLSNAYDDRMTHPSLTQKTVSFSKLETYLIRNFGEQYNKGSESFINGKKVIVWLTDGSTAEDHSPDIWNCRASTHFFNPLVADWRKAGLSNIPETFCLEYEVDGGPTRYSNLTWATGYESLAGPVVPRNLQQMGWDNARNFIYSALTSTINPDRESNFAKAFQAVGQVLHLLQDMGVPAHVRNDFLRSHVYTGLANPYEMYVKENPDLVNGLTDTSIIKPNFVSVRVTDFWDTNQTPDAVTDSSLQDKAGLSEYTNVNFVSEGTLFSSNTFSYPKQQSTIIDDHDIIDPFNPGTTVRRPYFYKAVDWEINYHLAGVSYTYFKAPGSIAPDIIIWPMDGVVHQDYAEKILPHVVGYSAALLDYFFRGTLEISTPEQFAYAVADGSVTPQQFTQIKAKVRNVTPNNESAQAGIIQAVAMYKNRPDYQPDLSTDPPISSNTVTYSYSVSAPITITSLDSAVATEFTFSFESSPIPAGITDLYLQVIFKGTLGNEADNAVAVGMKDLNEPMQIIVWNATDRFYLDHELKTASEIRSDPTLSARAAGQYIDPYDVTTKIAFSSSTSTPAAYQVTYEPLPAGRYGRVIVLTDTPSFYLHVHRESTNPVDSLDSYWPVAGVINQEIDGTFNNTAVYPFRTIIGHEWTAYARYYPDSTGIETAPWPAPSDLTAYPATTINQ